MKRTKNKRKSVEQTRIDLAQIAEATDVFRIESTVGAKFEEIGPRNPFASAPSGQEFGLKAETTIRETKAIKTNSL